MGTTRVERTITLAGVTPQQCWDYLTDLDNASAWNTFVKDAESPDEPGPGRRIEARVGFLGVSFTIRVRNTEHEEPTRYVIASSDRAPFEVELGSQVESVDGGTRMDSWTAIDPGRFFPVPGFVFRRAVERQFDKDLEILREQLESLAA